MASPKLRDAIPHLVNLFECLESVEARIVGVELSIGTLGARLESIEAQLKLEQGMGGAVEAWSPTITEPGTMPALDYDLDKLGD